MSWHVTVDICCMTSVPGSMENGIDVGPGRRFTALRPPYSMDSLASTLDIVDGSEL